MNLFSSLFQTKIHLSPAARSLASALEILIIGAAISTLTAVVQFLQDTSLTNINFGALGNLLLTTFSIAVVKGFTALMPQVRAVVAPYVSDAIAHLLVPPVPTTPPQTAQPAAPLVVVHTSGTPDVQAAPAQQQAQQQPGQQASFPPLDMPTLPMAAMAAMGTRTAQQ